MRTRMEINHGNFSRSLCTPHNVSTVDRSWEMLRSFKCNRRRRWWADVFEECLEMLRRCSSIIEWEGKINFQHFRWMSFTLEMFTFGSIVDIVVEFSSLFFLPLSSSNNLCDTFEDFTALPYRTQWKWKKRSLESLCSSRSNGNWFSYCGVFISFLSRFLSYSFDIDKNPFVHGDMIFYSANRQHDDDEAICGEWSIKMQINDGESFSKSSIHFIRIIMRCLRRKTRLTTEWERNKWTWDMRAAVNLLLVYETHQIQCWMIWIIRRESMKLSISKRMEIEISQKWDFFVFSCFSLAEHFYFIRFSSSRMHSKVNRDTTKELCCRKRKGCENLRNLLLSEERYQVTSMIHFIYKKRRNCSGLNDKYTWCLYVALRLSFFSFSFSNYNDDTQTMSRFRFTDKLILTTVDCLPSAMIMTRFCYCDSKNAHIKFGWR